MRLADRIRAGAAVALLEPRVREARVARCAFPRGAEASDWRDTMNYLVSAADTAGVCSDRGAGSARTDGLCEPASWRLPCSHPGGKGLSEWHFLPDLRVLGTASRPGSAVPDLSLLWQGAGTQALWRSPEPAGLGGSWKRWAQGPLARRKVPGSGKVAGGRPALPLPVAACCVTLGLRAQLLSLFPRPWGGVGGPLRP